MAGPTHDIGKDERQKCIEKPAADAIQNLHRQEPGRIVEGHAKKATQRESGECEQQERPATQRIRSGHQQGHKDRGELRDDNGGGGEARFPTGIGQCKLLHYERQHWCIGEMKQPRGGREHDKRANLE